MRVFITGTDTGVGKTLVSSWLCAHTGYDYFKPVQTGVMDGTDSEAVARLAGVVTHPEVYRYQAPVSPHWAAALEGESIQLEAMQSPAVAQLIIEGAGGVLVPLNAHQLMIDLMVQFNLPVILVASSRLGTINHSLLSLQALRARGLSVLGVIVSGEPQVVSCAAIEQFGQTTVLAQLPLLAEITRAQLLQQPLGERLSVLFTESVCRC